MLQTSRNKEIENHTPGPWEVEQQYERNSLAVRNARPLAFITIFNQASNLDYQSELRANAHLIAAAPELLEALEDLHSFSEVFGPKRAGDCAPEAVYSEWEPVFQKAVNAIRKAKGKAND